MFKDPVALFASVAAFGLVLSLWLMGVVLWARARKRRDDEVQQRLRFAESAITPQTGDGRILRLWLDGREATTVVPGLTDRGVIPAMRRLRLEAGWEASLTAVFFGLTA